METEHQRHQKAREAVLRGEKAPKRIMVQMTNTEEDKERSKEARLEREKKNERSDALKEARTPWFCPKCNKVMKHRNDDKMYRLNGQCFDCQIKFEHQLRLEGKFEEWEDDSQKPVEHFDQVGVKDVELHKETWSNNTEQVEKMAKESLGELNKMKSEVEEKLNSLEV